MEIKNIIFDFGGVLLDWNPRYLFEELIDDSEKLDFFLSEVCNNAWNLEQDRGRRLSDATSMLQKQFPEYHDYIQAYYDQWDKTVKRDIPENVKLLPVLKESYRMYGLTNFSDETLPRAMKRFPFFQVFEGIVVSGTEKMIKPDAEIYLLLLERYQLIAKESLFIDDSLPNIEAANALGIQTIHFHSEVDLSAELKKLNVL